MGEVIETKDHLAIQKRKRRIEPLRVKNQLKNRTTNTKRPFPLLSEEEKNEVLQYCVRQAYKFYTSNNSQF